MDQKLQGACITYEERLAARIELTLRRSLSRKLWKQLYWRLGLAALGFIGTGFVLLVSFRSLFPQIDQMPFVILMAVTLLFGPTVFVSARHMLNLLAHLQMAHLDLLVVLGNAVAKRDQDTAEHNFRVAIMAVRLAEAAQLDPQSILGLFMGAFLHDVGKVGISDNILLKPGTLSVDERQEMQKHVLHGIDIVTNSMWLQETARVIGFHHEKFDGSGYPHGAKAGAIPVEARIFSIVDVFDALASKRPYRDALPLEQTIEIMKSESNRSFDTEYLNTFLLIVDDLYNQVIEADLAKLKEMCAAIIERYSGHWPTSMV